MLALQTVGLPTLCSEGHDKPSARAPNSHGGKGEATAEGLDPIWSWRDRHAQTRSPPPVGDNVTAQQRGKNPSRGSAPEALASRAALGDVHWGLSPGRGVLACGAHRLHCLSGGCHCAVGAARGQLQAAVGCSGSAHSWGVGNATRSRAIELSTAKTLPQAPHKAINFFINGF